MSLGNGKKPALHKNVYLSYVFQLTYGIAFSVALGPLFDVYLFQIAGKGQGNLMVGKVESISGLVALALVLPVGIIVDKWNRVNLMRVASFCGILTTLLGAAAIYYTSIPLWFATMAVNGVYTELGNSVCYALFADSIQSEQRSKATSTMGIISNVAQAVGPMMTFLSMFYLGNSWTTEGLEKVLMFGMVVLNPIACFVMFLFAKAPYEKSAGEEDEGEGDTDDAGTMLRRLPGAPAVPWLVAISDLVTCIGAGMTIKYFNLYWKNTWLMSPTDVLAIAAVQPLAIAVFIKLLDKPAEKCGRAQSSCACFFIGACCFLLLAYPYNLPVSLFFYFVRSGMANSVYPINKSIMFDFTPSHQRGRWNAVETLSGSVWSGSAFIGGFLSDAHGYSFTFMFTAGIYMVAMLIYSPLLCIVPRGSRPKTPGESPPFLASPGTGGKPWSPGPAHFVAQASYASPSTAATMQYQALPDVPKAI